MDTIASNSPTTTQRGEEETNEFGLIINKLLIIDNKLSIDEEIHFWLFSLIFGRAFRSSLLPLPPPADRRHRIGRKKIEKKKKS